MTLRITGAGFGVGVGVGDGLTAGDVDVTGVTDGVLVESFGNTYLHYFDFAQTNKHHPQAK